MKSPVLSLTILLTLALAIGTNTAVFTVLNEVFSKTLPFKDSERIITMYENEPAITYETYPSFVEAFKNGPFEELGACRWSPLVVSDGVNPVRVVGARVSSSVLKVFGLQPYQGRFFRSDEEKFGGPSAVILGYTFWQKHFSGDEQIIGKTLHIEGQPTTVIGIMPKYAEQFAPTSIWSPIGSTNSNQPGFMNTVFLMAKLKPNALPQQAESYVRSVSKHMSVPKDHQISVTTLNDEKREYQKDSIPVIWLWMGIASFILVIGCTNVVNLLLARGSKREKEVALRISLGATRAQLIRLLLVESLLLSLLGGIFGLILAYWAKDIFGAISLINTAIIDWRVLLFTAAISIFAGVVAGILPALHLSRGEINSTLKESGRNSSGGVRGEKTRGVLVITQISMAVVLVIGAGLLIKDLILQMNMNPGIKTRELLVVNLPISFYKYSNRDLRLAFYHDLLERIKSIPGVDGAALSSQAPLLGANPWNVKVEGSTKRWVSITYQTISSDYFKVLGLPVDGRSFQDSDRMDSTRVAIVNQAFAKKFWPGESALGKAFLYEREEDRPATVIGVVKDIHQAGMGKKIEPLTYLSTRQEPGLFNLLVRSATPVSTMSNLITSQIRALDRDAPIESIKTLDQTISDSMADRRMQMWLLLSLGITGFLISMIGIFGLISYSVACRTQEIGVRIAIGAQKRDILKMVTRQGALLALIGLFIGVLGATALTKFLSSMIFGITPTDPETFAVVCVFFVMAASIASYFPARRAAKIDPVIALRHE